MQSLYYIDDSSYHNFVGITVYLVYYNWYLVKNNIFCIKFNTRKKKKKIFMNEWNYIKNENKKFVFLLNIKNRAYYFYNGIIVLENFYAKLLKIDKK